MISIRIATPLVAACLTLILGACSSDATAPQSGHASAVVKDNPNSTSPSARMARSATLAPSADYRATSQSISGSAISSFSGSMTSTMQVAFSVDGQSWIDLGSPVQSTLQLQNADDSTTLATQATVPVGTYAYVRLTLQGAGAQVTGSFAGIAYTDAQVSVGDGGQCVIEKQVRPFTITAGGNATVVFDVNSELWITAQSVQSQTAAAAEMEAAAMAGVE